MHAKLNLVSQRLPEEMRRLSRVLMAGEDVLFMEKPDTKNLLRYEAMLGVAGFVVLFLFTTVFASDLPIPMRLALSVVFALFGGGILHFGIGTCTYVITDKRLLVVTDFNSELKDSCELQDITEVRRLDFGKALVVERGSGKPIRLFALSNRDEAERALVGS